MDMYSRFVGRPTGAACLLLLATVYPLPAQSSTPDLSGRWVLNPARSTLPKVDSDGAEHPFSATSTITTNNRPDGRSSRTHWESGTAGATVAPGWWPAKGAVILEGGHIQLATFDKVAKRLIALAGGTDALIVIIPTANEAVAPRLRGTGPAFDTNELVELLKSKGAKRVSVLHTRSRQVANSEEFVKILRSAGGVWIPGGGARILETTYRGTLVARELKAVLERGGVLAGDSAGAIALGCFMLGWTPDPWGIVVQGLAALPDVAVIPHANAAQGYVPWEEALKYLALHPGPVGAVIDENTALVLNGSAAEVLGEGNVAIVDPAKDKTKPYLLMKAGERKSLAP
jgi:cyanophycinase